LPRTSIDELLKAIETVGILKDAVAEQDAAITLMDRRLDKLEALLSEIVGILNSLNRSLP